MNISDLETPSVLIDLDRMEGNIQRMQAHCDQIGIGFRPHIKTHKIPDIAKMQLEAGAVGIACQKVSEAEVFSNAGIENIQIPYNIIGAKKTARLADLSLYNRVTVSADSAFTLAGLSEAAHANEINIRVMVDLVTDIQRTGASVDDVVQLAKKIDADENLYFAGLLVYPSFPLMRPAIQEVMQELEKVGIAVESVSGGGYGAALQASEVPELTEVRVGTYLFNDMNSVSKEWATLDDCAMTVLATVVSHSTSDRMILDSGSKTLAADRLNEGHGYIVEYPEAQIYQLSEEHAHVDISKCAGRPAIGEQVHVIPVHTCVVTNLHNQIYGVRGDTVEVTWPIAARGLVW